MPSLRSLKKSRIKNKRIFNRTPKPFDINIIKPSADAERVETKYGAEAVKKLNHKKKIKDEPCEEMEDVTNDGSQDGAVKKEPTEKVQKIPKAAIKKAAPKGKIAKKVFDFLDDDGEPSPKKFKKINLNVKF